MFNSGPHNIQALRGLSTNRTLLSGKSDGTLVDLWNEDDLDGRQAWILRQVAGTETYNIVVNGGVSANRLFLSCSMDSTLVDLWSVDDGSGRQRWKLERVAGSGIPEYYNIRTAAIGLPNNRVLLSCTENGTKVDLWHTDDGSGRQRWQMQPLV